MIKYNNTTYIPDRDSVLTVKELINILQNADPDALVCVVPDFDNGNFETDYIAAVDVRKSTIGLCLQSGMDITNLYDDEA